MLCIRLPNYDPYFCLATEEYLLKNFSEDIFMLWQCEDTVVIGKHQNAMAEINYPFVTKNNIKIARRISGGGTVFHDAGNLNFAYIKNVDSPSEISFSRFVQPIIEALKKLDVQVITSGRNDLLVGSKKISGNAEHIYKNRVLHHGTLLFNSNLKALGQSIKVVPGKYIGKAVQSNRSEVTNILPCLKNNWTIGEFTEFLLNFELEKYGNTIYELSEADNYAVQQLADDRFSTWDWNFGYSPKYTFQNQVQVHEKQLIVELRVEKGHITESLISGNYFSGTQIMKLNSLLPDTRHFRNDILQQLLNIQPEIPDTLIDAFF